MQQTDRGVGFIPIQDTAERRIDAIYARQSIDKADSISVDSQIEFCKYETRGGAYQVYADKGYSGKNTDRPEFQRMLNEIRAGTIRRVICYKLDRCSRSILDFAALIEEFQKYGVEFVSCTEKFDTSTPMGRAMLNICIVFAQLERETIQQRVYDAYHSRSKKGFYMGGRVPFGFRLVPCMIGGKRTSCYAPEESEVQILQNLYERYALPSASLGDVVREMQEAGISNPRRKDGRWVRSHIGRMLCNPIYVKADMHIYHHFKDKGVTICNDPGDFIGTNGCYLYTEKEGTYCLVIAPHKGLISSDVWLQCRKKHVAASKQTTDGSQSTWLAGKLKCSRCGNGLVIAKSTKKNGKSYRYIVCPHSHGANSVCGGLRGWKAETAEQLLAELLKQRLQICFPRLENGSMKPNPNRNALDIRIAQIQCEIEKSAAKALESGGALLPYLNDYVRTLERQKSELICRASAYERNGSSNVITPDYDGLWEHLSQKEKKLVADALIDSITLAEDSICVIWKL